MSYHGGGAPPMLAKDSEYWNQLTQQQKYAAMHLGWDDSGAMWDAGTLAPACELSWEELDKRDQSAASYLGYDQQSWNAELEDSGVDAAGGDDHAERDLMGVGGGGGGEDPGPAVVFLHEQPESPTRPQRSGADIAEMSVEQFLREHGAQDAVAGFRQNGFETVAQLVRAQLNDRQLKQLGLASLKIRKFVSNELQKLSAEADAKSVAAAEAEEAAQMKAAMEHEAQRAREQAQQRAATGTDMRSARDQPAPAPLRAPGEALSFPPMAPPKSMPSLDGGGASDHPPAGTAPSSSSSKTPPSSPARTKQHGVSPLSPGGGGRMMMMMTHPRSPGGGPRLGPGSTMAPPSRSFPAPATGLAAPAGLSLYDAAKQSDVGAVEALLSNGKKPNDPNQCGPSYRKSSPLHEACNLGHERIVQLLIKAGANVNADDAWGNTPLQYAAGQGSIELIRLLAQAGAVVDVKSKRGRTPLHRAAVEGDSIIVTELLRAGADDSVRDADGCSAKDDAIRKGHRNVVVALDNYKQTAEADRKRREADKARQEQLEQDQKAKQEAARELEQAKDAFARAEIMCKQQQWDGASAELSLALKCGHPDMAKCHQWRGYCLDEMGRSDEALFDLSEVARLQPTPPAFYNYGRQLEKMGRLEEAIVEYDKCAEGEEDVVKAAEARKNARAARDKLKAQQSMFRPDAPVFVRQAFPTFAVNFD